MRSFKILLCCFITFNMSAQTITNLDTSDGLISNFVECIAIDINGDTWIGTSIGLQKKTGNNWTNYTTNNYPGMANNNIKVITAMSNGDIWIGTDYGASKFDGSNWITYNTSNGLNNNLVKSIDEDINSNGGVWIGTMTGVSHYDGSSWTSYSAPNLHWSGVNATAIASNGDVWFGSPLGGITHYDGISFTNYDTSHGLISQNVTDLIIDNQDNKWVGTGGGVSILDATNSQFTNHTRMYILPPPDTLNPVVNIDITTTGKVWAAIYVGYLGVGGVACWDNVSWSDFDNITDGLSGPNIRGLTIDNNNNVWVATSTGISIISNISSSIEKFIEDPFVIFPNPTTEKITLISSQKIEYIKITNTLGKVINYQKDVFANQITLSLLSRPKGTYFIELKTDNNIYSKKIILN